jgi:Flp pilus assembly protein TadG
MPKSRRGQSLVETALVLPILLLLVTGMIQFGILLGGQNALVNGVREAARFGSVLETTSVGDANTHGPSVKQHLRDVLAAGMPAYSAANLTSVNVCYGGYQNPGSAEYSVRLTITAVYSHALFIPIISHILDGVDGTNDSGLTLSATERFRVENLPLSSTDLTTPPGHCVP